MTAVCSDNEDEDGIHFISQGMSESPGMENRMHMMLAKMMEDKHTFTYKKLVVPMSMRSIYWKYFGFPATDADEILTKVKIVCTLCKTQIAYNRNTSNLRMHLHNKHPEELQKLEAAFPRSMKNEDSVQRRYSTPRKGNKTPNLSQPLYSRAIDGTVSIEGDLHFITDPSISLRNSDEDFYEPPPHKPVRVSANQNVHLMMDEEEGEELSPVFYKRSLSDAISEFVVTDLEQTSVVEGKGFQELVATLMSPCEIPSRDKLQDVLIPKLYAAHKEAAFNTVANLTCDMGLSVEEWQHCNGETYITISVHYQPDADHQLETKVLSTIHCYELMDWNSTLDQLVTEWDLKLERVTAVVMATNQLELYRCLQQKQITTISCLVYSLQICTNAIFAQEDVMRVLSRVRCIVALISRNAAASTALQIQTQLIQPCLQEDAVLKMDFPRVWTTTYNMLEAVSQLKSSLHSVLDNIDGLDKTNITLTDSDWRIIEDLVTVLEPFKVTQVTLSEEKFPLISLLKPLLWQLSNLHLKPRPSDSETATAFKESLAENLAERYSDSDVNVTLQTATALDPRFKKLPYASDEDKEMVGGFIRDELHKLVALSDDEHDEASEPSPKKPRLSGLELILGDMCSARGGSERDSERGALELAQYQSEGSAALDDCPIQWWSRAQSRCPHLARLAQRYNCVPASTIPVSRIPSLGQSQFSVKRAALEPDIVDKMLFLHSALNAVETLL